MPTRTGRPRDSRFVNSGSSTWTDFGSSSTPPTVWPWASTAIGSTTRSMSIADGSIEIVAVTTSTFWTTVDAPRTSTTGGSTVISPCWTPGGSGVVSMRTWTGRLMTWSSVTRTVRGWTSTTNTPPTDEVTETGTDTSRPTGTFERSTVAVKSLALSR